MGDGRILIKSLRTSLLMTTYRMSLISAGSISLDSTFQRVSMCINLSSRIHASINLTRTVLWQGFPAVWCAYIWHWSLRSNNLTACFKENCRPRVHTSTWEFPFLSTKYWKLHDATNILILIYLINDLLVLLAYGTIIPQFGWVKNCLICQIMFTFEWFGTSESPAWQRPI
jgi:hypothetical protein